MFQHTTCSDPDGDVAVMAGASTIGPKSRYEPSDFAARERPVGRIDECPPWIARPGADSPTTTTQVISWLGVLVPPPVLDLSGARDVLLVVGNIRGPRQASWSRGWAPTTGLKSARDYGPARVSPTNAVSMTRPQPGREMQPSVERGGMIIRRITIFDWR